jgi:hypothetical protein
MAAKKDEKFPELSTLATVGNFGKWLAFRSSGISCLTKFSSMVKMQTFDGRYF